MIWERLAFYCVLVLLPIFVPAASVLFWRRLSPSATRRKLVTVAALSAPTILSIIIAFVVSTLIYFELTRDDPESLYDVPQRTMGLLVFIILPVVWAVCAPVGLIIGLIATRRK